MSLTHFLLYFAVWERNNGKTGFLLFTMRPYVMFIKYSQHSYQDRQYAHFTFQGVEKFSDYIINFLMFLGWFLSFL